MNWRGCLVAAAAAVVAALGAATLTGCTTQPLPAGPSDTDVAAYYAAFSDARWQSMGFGPSVERPVITNASPIPQEVWATRIADCMNGAGYLNYSEQGGGLSMTPTDGAVMQTTGEKVALYICQEMYPVESDSMGVLSEPQLRYIYAYYVRFLVPCLESRGYDLGDVPPGDAFVEQGNLGVWNPYWGEITSDADALAAVQAECPPMPPGIADAYGR